MAFTLRDISAVLGEKINRLRPWVSLGYVKPSVREAGYRGDTNFFSLEDVYKFSILKNLVDMGWSRETIGKLIKTLDDDKMLPITTWWRNEWRMMRDFALVGGFDDYAKGNNPEITEAMIKFIEDQIPKGKLLIAFLMFPQKIIAWPACENPETYKGGPVIMSDLSELTEYIAKAPYTFTIELSRTMRDIDDLIRDFFPKVFMDEMNNRMQKTLGDNWRVEFEKMRKAVVQDFEKKMRGVTDENEG